MLLGPFDDTVARIVEVKAGEAARRRCLDVGAGAEWTSFVPRGRGWRDNYFHIKEVDTLSLLTPAQWKQFIAENPRKTAEDVREALKAVFAETLQALLDRELDSHLGYEKYAIGHKQTPNRPGGRSKKTLSTQYGDVEGSSALLV